VASVAGSEPKTKLPTQAELNRGLKAVSKAFGTAASIVRKPDGTIHFVPCNHPKEMDTLNTTAEFRL
jgi:hypothetical protein